MKILILSPLFPPDTGTPAAYVKELAGRLRDKDISLLIYGYLPEAVSTIPIRSIDKRQLLPLRLFRFTLALLKESKEAKHLIINNAPSVELPALIVSFIRPVNITLLLSDPVAEKASGHGLYKILHTLLKQRSRAVITLPQKSVYEKTETLPFTPFDDQKEQMREAWWREHVSTLIV
jgi:hypothetical protein